MSNLSLSLQNFLNIATQGNHWIATPNGIEKSGILRIFLETIKGAFGFGNKASLKALRFSFLNLIQKECHTKFNLDTCKRIEKAAYKIGLINKKPFDTDSLDLKKIVEDLSADSFEKNQTILPSKINDYYQKHKQFLKQIFNPPQPSISLIGSPPQQNGPQQNETLNQLPETLEEEPQQPPPQDEIDIEVKQENQPETDTKSKKSSMSMRKIMIRSGIALIGGGIALGIATAAHKYFSNHSPFSLTDNQNLTSSNPSLEKETLEKETLTLNELTAPNKIYHLADKPLTLWNISPFQSAVFTSLDESSINQACIARGKSSETLTEYVNKTFQSDDIMGITTSWLNDEIFKNNGLFGLEDNDVLPFLDDPAETENTEDLLNPQTSFLEKSLDRPDSLGAIKYVGFFNDRNEFISGIITYRDGTTFEGKCKENLPYKGVKKRKIQSWPRSITEKRKGKFGEDGLLTGQGTLRFSHPDMHGAISYSGIFKAGDLIEGTITYQNGNVYIGPCELGIPGGKGEMIFASKPDQGKHLIRFVGNFVKGKPQNGPTIIDYSDGSFYKGNVEFEAHKNWVFKTNSGKIYANADQETRDNDDLEWEGELISPRKHFIGTAKGNLPIKGTMTDKNSEEEDFWEEVKKGEFKDNLLTDLSGNAKIIEISKDSNNYRKVDKSGYFQDGRLEGRGTLKEEKCENSILCNNPHSATIKKKVEQGDFRKNELHGEGSRKTWVESMLKGSSIYQKGTFDHGKLNGNVVISEQTYHGLFIDQYTGKFEHGKPVGQFSKESHFLAIIPLSLFAQKVDFPAHLI